MTKIFETPRMKKELGASSSCHLATQEAEIRRIEVQSQPGQIVHEPLFSKFPNTKTGLAECCKW
jgi:hypothetical protein